MKAFLLSALLVVICLMSCTEKETPQVITNDNSVVLQGKTTTQLNLNPFMVMVRNNTYPTNLLSQQTISEFNKSLIFNEQNEIVSGNYSQIEAELSEKEFTTFFETLFLKEVKFLDRDESTPELDIAPNLARASCCIIYFKRHHIKHPISGNCIASPGNFCVTCSPCYD